MIKENDQLRKTITEMEKKSLHLGNEVNRLTSLTQQEIQDRDGLRQDSTNKQEKLSKLEAENEALVKKINKLGPENESLK